MANRTKVFNMTGGKCCYCGCNLDFYNFHIDHVIPKSAGGKTKGNVVPSCPDCNRAKGVLSVEEFREKIKNLIYSSCQGRLIGKYYGIEEKDIKFFFEENSNGVL